jgi:signal transduction histidine kinase
VGALVQALAAGRELQRSRERLVAAREEERRRLRRDLHDGLGPSLATTLMRLEVARDLVDRDPVAARGLVGQLVDQTEADIVEVRRLVDGLRPPALDQLGLVSALRQRADHHNHAVALGSGAPRWTVVADDIGALPAAVEVAAYRIVVEAVNNAVRHSGATEVTVRLQLRPDALELVVRDDGAGLTDVRGTGVGLGSMRDRATEVGGSCTVSSPPEGGTEVAARLPLTDPGDQEEV